MVQVTSQVQRFVEVPWEEDQLLRDELISLVIKPAPMSNWQLRRRAQRQIYR